MAKKKPVIEIILPDPPDPITWTYPAEIEKELSYISVQLEMGQGLHEFIQKSIAILRELGYPEDDIAYISAQFAKPKDRDRPHRSPEIEQYFKELVKCIADLLMRYMGASAEAALKMAEELLHRVLATKSIEDLMSVKRSVEAMLRTVLKTVAEPMGAIEKRCEVVGIEPLVKHEHITGEFTKDQMALITKYITNRCKFAVGVYVKQLNVLPVHIRHAVINGVKGAASNDVVLGLMGLWKFKNDKCAGDILKTFGEAVGIPAPAPAPELKPVRPIYDRVLEPLAQEARKYTSAEEFIKSLEERISIRELGLIKSKWIHLPGLLSINVGGAEESDSVIIQRGIHQYKLIARDTAIENELRNKYPNEQIYRGPLPQNDIEFGGKPGEYFYVLKDRKSKGKYQVKLAIIIEDIPFTELNLVDFYNAVVKETKTYAQTLVPTPAPVLRPMTELEVRIHSDIKKRMMEQLKEQESIYSALAEPRKPKITELPKEERIAIAKRIAATMGTGKPLEKKVITHKELAKITKAERIALAKKVAHAEFAPVEAE